MKDEIWCEKRFDKPEGNIMIAIVRRSGETYTKRVVEITIKNVIYQRGYPSSDWHSGTRTAIVESDLKEPKQVVKFMFEQI